MRADGSLVQLLRTDQVDPFMTEWGLDVSPDGRQIVYQFGDDIWLMDIASRQTRNITRTPNRRESYPRWLPDQSGFVCGSYPVPPPEEGIFAGYLTLVTLDGASQVLDDTGILGAPPAPSPDGSTIAYARLAPDETLNTFRLYHRGEGARDFSLSTYGFDWPSRAGEASWSPDGKQLAWGLVEMRGGAGGDEWQAAVVLFDLSGQTNRVIDEYEPWGEGFVPAPRWSPDGNRLVFNANSGNQEQSGIWLVELQNSEMHIQGPFAGDSSVNPGVPEISPDGRQAAFTVAQWDVGLLDLDTAQPAVAVWDVPQHVDAIRWVTLP